MVFWYQYLCDTIIILLLSCSGIFYVFKEGLKENRQTSLLVLLWFAIPIIRVTLPGAGIYGGVRQIMEFIPAMAILSGIGAAYIVGRLRGRLNVVLKLLIVASFIPVTAKLISLHPNEGLYFNSFIGGFKGAMSKNFLDANYDLGNPYRQAIVWANNNLEIGAKLALFAGLGSDIPGTQLREDIKFSNLYRSGFERRGEYVLGLMENVNEDSYGDPFIYHYYNNFMNPFHEIKVEGVPIVRIWKNDDFYAKSKYKNQEKIQNTTLELSENYLLIDLKNPRVITKIMVFFGEKPCTRADTGLIEIALNNDEWEIVDNDIVISGFYYTVYNYKSGKEFDFPTEFVYPIAAIEASKIKITHNSHGSCFGNNISSVEVYGLKP